MLFDTRDKKPTLWNVVVLTEAVAVLSGILAFSGASRNAVKISVILVVYFLAVIVMLLIAFFRQLQYNPYSYNTIYYMGFSLFLVSVLVTHYNLTMRMIRAPGQYSLRNIASVLLSSARNYMLLTAPLILLFSIALCISNISLIRHEGKRLVNVLGIILSVLLVGGIVFLSLFDFYMQGSLAAKRFHVMFGSIFSAAYLYFECMLIGVIIAAAIVIRYRPGYDKDFLIILGCGIQEDGRPSPLLRGRIDKALDFSREQSAQTGKELIFVTSGGQGPNEVISESASMKQYLLEQGIPAGRIIEEDRSTTTLENMKFSKEKIDAVNPGGRVAFSTTNYHVFRSGLCARRVKMRAVGMGSKTRWYFWPNAAVREFVGLLTEHRFKQALVFGGMITVYTLLTIVVYR